MTARRRHGGLITVGYEPTAVGRAALRRAAHLSRQLDTRLRIVDMGSDADRLGRDVRAEFSGRVPDWVEIESECVDPAAALVASSVEARAIVMGRDRADTDEWFRTGPRALRCIADAACPVLLIPSGPIAPTIAQRTVDPRGKEIRPWNASRQEHALSGT